MADVVDEELNITIDILPPLQCSDYTNPSECIANNCYWYNNSCHDTVNCEIINNQNDCENNNCYWYNNSCHSSPQQFECEDYTNQIDCENNNCYWYNGSCHDAPALISNPSSNSPVQQGENVVIDYLITNIHNHDTLWAGIYDGPDETANLIGGYWEETFAAGEQKQKTATLPPITQNTTYYIQAGHVQPPEMFTLTINSETGGTTSPEPGTYQIQEGTEVTIEGIPNDGYIFQHWTSTQYGTITENPFTFIMTQDVTITAHFGLIPITHTLHMIIATTGGTPGVDGGTTSPESGTHQIPDGTNVTIEAFPYAGYSFTGWSGYYTGTTNPHTFIMTEDAIINANFIKEGQAIIINPSSNSPVEKDIENVEITYDIQNTGHTDTIWAGIYDGPDANATLLGGYWEETFAENETKTKTVVLPPISFPTTFYIQAGHIED